MGAGKGTFDSVNGTYDEQTSFGFDKQLWHELLTRTIIGSLSKGGQNVTDMYAGQGTSLDGTQAIAKKEITSGDEVRFTMQEAVTGTPTYGDNSVARGDYLAYKNMYARVNNIKTPAIPVQGEMAQQRVRESITDIPGAVKEAVLDYLAEQIEFEAIISWLYGAGPSILLPTSEGGLGVRLGVNDGATAGTPLLPRHFYTPDTGYIADASYSTTVATWNSTVNDAINGIDAASGDYISLAQIELIRSVLDDIGFWPVNINGKKYKAINLCDPVMWYRINHLLADYYKYAAPRSDDNKIFGVDHTVEYDGMLFVAVPNLKKFRMAYNVTTGYPDIGPGLRTDPRTYTSTSYNALMISVGAKSLIEGFNGSVKLTKAEGNHEDGLEISARTKVGFMRGEWFAKDGRTDASAVKNYSTLVSAFYEPGVGTGY